MFAQRFDGLDFVVLSVRRAAPLVELYGDLLGFEPAADDRAPDPRVATLLGLPDDVSRLVHLRRGPDTGGDVVLIETPSAPAPRPGPPERRPGVYALDFYLREAARTEQALADAGWSFCSEAVHYDLPGTTIGVRERMLLQDHAGLLHALVQHRPGGTRSVLGTDGTGTCSEVVAVVALTDDLPGARRFATEVLGGTEYFKGTFAGAAVEKMIDYAPGEGLEASLFRGPGSRNARLEFARPVDATGAPLPMGSTRGTTEVQVGLLVDDLDHLGDRLGDGTHGRIVAETDVSWAGTDRRALRFETRYGVSLVLIESPNPHR